MDIGRFWVEGQGRNLRSSGIYRRSPIVRTLRMIPISYKMGIIPGGKQMRGIVELKDHQTIGGTKNVEHTN